MLGSFFSYLSSEGYVSLGALALAFVVLIVGLIRLLRGDKQAKLEKTIRYVGLFTLLATLVCFITFLDWADGHGYVVRDDGVKANISEQSANLFFYIFMTLSVLWITLMGVSWRMKVLRDRVARKKMIEMRRVLTEEYGYEEASRIMEKAGHNREWKDSQFDVV